MTANLLQKTAVSDTPSFQAWFAGSQVVKPDGSALVVYHGTAAYFDTFEKGDIGFHVGTEHQAHARLEGHDKQDVDSGQWHVMALFASIRHPLRTRDAGNWNTPLDCWYTVNQALSGELDWFKEPMMAYIRENGGRSAYPHLLGLLRDELIKRGYDGIVYSNQFEEAYDEGMDSWIAFDPGQLRSATGEHGAN